MSGYVTERTVLTNVQTADITNDAVTLAKLAGGTDGNVITYDASGNPAAVAVGTSTHVLTSNGAGAAPTFKVTTSPTDLRLMFLLIAENAADRLNMIDGHADPFKDEGDVDTALSANEVYDATNDLYQGARTYTSDRIPDMTANDAPSGTASASSEEAGSAFAWYAFNDATAQGWGSDVTTTGWLAYEFTSNKTITRYTLNGGQDGYSNRAPKNWTFEGWTGSAWVVLQTVTNETGWSPPTEQRIFTFSNTTAYIKYQLNVSAINGGNVTAVIEMEMIEDDGRENITLVSNAFTADSAPDTGRIHIQAKPVEAITINTDLTAEISRDGGTTFTTATLVAKETLSDGTVAYEDASVDISGQPDATDHTSMKWRIKTLNTKDIEVHGVVLQWA